MFLRRCSSSLLRFQLRFIHHDQIVRSTKSIDTSQWATSDTNPLIKQISARIKATGPITVAEFMRESLLNPNHVSKDNQHDRHVIVFLRFRVIIHDTKYSERKAILSQHRKSVKCLVK